MKRFLIVLLLLALAATPAFAADSGYTFDSAKLGIRFTIDEALIDAVDNQTLSYWVRRDDDVRKGDVLGYALIYLTPTLDGFSPKTYAEGEEWLNQHAMALSGILVTKAETADLSGVLPAFDKTPIGQAGGAHFTLLTPASLDRSKLNDKQAAIVDTLLATVSDPDHYIFSDATIDYGLLGAFSAETITGETVDNSLVTNAKLTVVNFWATNCNPCISELPDLEALAQAYKDQGVAFLGVALDAMDDETRAYAAEILDATGVTYPNIGPEVSNDVMSRVTGTPTTVFLDQSGKRVGEVMVGAYGKKAMSQAIDALLK